MTHHEIVTRMSLIWHSDQNIWELSLSSVYTEIVRRMNIKNTLTYAFMCTNVQLMKLKTVNKVPKAVNDLVKALDSKVIKALTEPARAEILKFLMLNGRSDISTIAENLPQDRSVISRHLNLLAEAGIVIAEKETRHKFYTINGSAFLKEFESIAESIKKCMAECCPESL